VQKHLEHTRIDNMKAQLSRTVVIALLFLAVAAASRPAFEATYSFDSHVSRQLQQQGQANCTKPLPISATKLPYCFQPDTGTASARLLH
jgi:hypothetical protein